MCAFVYYYFIKAVLGAQLRKLCQYKNASSHFSSSQLATPPGTQPNPFHRKANVGWRVPVGVSYFVSIGRWGFFEQ